MWSIRLASHAPKQAPANGNFRANIKIDGFNETMAQFKGLPAEVQVKLKAAAGEIATMVAQDIRADASRSANHQARALAPLVKVAKDRVIKVTVGGASKVFKGTVKGKDRAAFSALFATEFGLNRMPGHGFQRHAGAHSYWFLATVDRDAAAAGAIWKEAAQQIVNDFNAGKVTP